MVIMMVAMDKEEMKMVTMMVTMDKEEEVDGDADGQEAGGSGDHRDHRSRARKVQYKNPSGPLQTPENMH